MDKQQIPYGSSYLNVNLPAGLNYDLILPPTFNAVDDPIAFVKNAISHPISGDTKKISEGKKIGIAINDKTRPVPHQYLLPPLIDFLQSRGVATEDITIFIATGSHKPMSVAEFHKIIPEEVLRQIKVVTHDVDELENFIDLGKTKRGTPVQVNRKYFDSDVRIVVGDIELHHFAGFSGGVKSAVIGLGSKASIQHNHQMLTDEFATIGIYEENPLRQDIEESGEIIGIDFALNAVLTEDKEIVTAFFGKPKDVMGKGIAIVRQMSSVKLTKPYDIVIASAGGFPKDINLYQAQKAISHARLFARRGGTVILVAECRESLGSSALETFIKDVETIPEIYEKFNKMGFVIGAHKAVQIARQLETHQIILVSTINPEVVKSVLITPAASISEAIEVAIQHVGNNPSIAVLPYATGVFPAR